MLAIDRPIALEIDCPATNKAAVTTCSVRPINKPMAN